MPPPVRSASSRGEPSLAPVQVSFYRRMKLQRVYPFTVRWQKGAAAVAGQKVTVRLLMAGAQVLPSEQTLDAGKPEATATFFVTPLARGWLRAQRLEIIHEGRKVQEVPLASKATTQRLTWFFLFMMFLAPWLIHSYVKNSPFRETTAFDASGNKTIKMNLGVDSSGKKSRVLVDVERALADNVPEMPELVDEYVPQVNPALKDARAWVAQTYVVAVNASQDQPYAFYGGLLFLLLALISALTHRDVVRRRYSKPIALPAAARASIDDEDEVETASTR